MYVHLIQYLRRDLGFHYPILLRLHDLPSDQVDHDLEMFDAHPNRSVCCGLRGSARHRVRLSHTATENWSRPRSEVAALLRMLSTVIESEARTCLRDNMRLQLVGRVDQLSPELQAKVTAAIEMNSENTGLALCLAFDYGSRGEMVRAAQELSRNEVPPGAVDEEQVSLSLYTAGMPDVDLLVRCGGELRLSNFLMWQAAYAELYFTDVLWPDFRDTDVDNALAEYSRRSRRFGALPSGESS